MIVTKQLSLFKHFGQQRMRNALFAFLGFSYFLGFGQGPNTQLLFYNLPVNQNKEAVKAILLGDTLNFRNKLIDNAHYFFPAKQDSFFYSSPKAIELKVQDVKYRSDSIARPEMILFIHYPRSVKTGEMKAFYNKLVDFVQPEYGDVKQEYIKGQRKEGKKISDVDEYTSDLYIHKKGSRQKCSIAWFDEGKYGHLIMLYYRFD